ncbi:hypothetical protein EIL87_19825, partial [Saccharopolyspora rhizosphaerae]
GGRGDGLPGRRGAALPGRPARGNRLSAVPRPLRGAGGRPPRPVAVRRGRPHQAVRRVGDDRA